MDHEDDGTTMMLLVKSPGISSMEAMAVSLDALQGAVGHFQKERLSHTASSYTLKNVIRPNTRTAVQGITVLGYFL